MAERLRESSNVLFVVVMAHILPNSVLIVAISRTDAVSAIANTLVIQQQFAINTKMFALGAGVTWMVAVS